jgi:hypothetical protein
VQPEPTQAFDRETIRRIFEEQGFGNAELLEGCNDLEELRAHLTPEEMETLQDELRDRDE